MTKQLQKSSFQVKAINEPNSLNDVIWALDYEFSLPLPNGNRWDLNNDIIQAYSKSANITILNQ